METTLNSSCLIFTHPNADISWDVCRETCWQTGGSEGTVMDIQSLLTGSKGTGPWVGQLNCPREKCPGTTCTQLRPWLKVCGDFFFSVVHLVSVWCFPPLVSVIWCSLSDYTITVVVYKNHNIISITIRYAEKTCDTSVLLLIPLNIRKL